MNSLKNELRKAKCLQDKKIDETGYLKSYSHNICGGSMPYRFKRMFEKGSGNELTTKAKAVHSSSMLSYNFFHWVSEETPLHFRGGVYTSVFFEVKMKTIKKSSQPANMDVVLVGKKDGENHWLFIESKFLEYTENSKFEISDSYSDPNRWLSKYTYLTDFTRLIYDAKAICKKRCYGGGIKQSITHLFGLGSLTTGPGLKYFRWNNHKELVQFYDNGFSFDFINLIFEPAKCFKESQSYESYKLLYQEFIESVKQNKANSWPKYDNSPEWISYSEFWNEVKDQMPHELKEYLATRYMDFAEPSCVKAQTATH